MARILLTVYLALVMMTVGLPLSAQQPVPAAINEAQKALVTDDVFLAQTVRHGRAEIELGKIAVTKAERPDVKIFAQRMIDDHTKLTDEIVMLARSKSTILPNDPVQLDKAKAEALEKAEGNAFDRLYMQEAIADHQRMVDAFTEHSARTVDVALRTWIAKTLPIVQQHLDAARELGKKTES